ncbi:WD40-repeat-containing domain protein [Vararia minispora EC-137]|uniref:WD40-repeat-containing domain protein n=1 Tax=Vararia minispora EC-137 TaxID=1314806 RepID=A0ACB8QTE6_9AGAM|nr:WD40-repeat-containing domain protein [Vararia minispora EC-137]
MDGAQEYVWTPPSYNFSRKPVAAAHTKLAPDLSFPHNFARCGKWCPDGSVALMQCENRTFQTLHLQVIEVSNFPTGSFGFSKPSEARIIPQAEAIVDFAWYPRATLHDPASYCFVTSVRECPVRLLDASDGRLRASYRIVDHRERQIAPHSLAFNVVGDKLYCGFQDAVEVFDLNAPGQGTRLPTTPSRKNRDGLKGIISSIAFCPTYDPSSQLFAAGSLAPSSSISSNIALYDEGTGTARAMGWIGDVRASVTQLAFNPMKPYILYSSFRRHGAIYSWDLRSDTSVPFQVFGLEGDKWNSTNQKLRFDVDIAGRWLAVGGLTGRVSIFNLDDPPPSAEGGTGTEKTQPYMVYHAHEDAVGSVGFHPMHPLLLSVSGSRHFDTMDDNMLHGEQGTESESDPEEAPAVLLSRARRQPSVVDSSVRLWGF